MRCDRQAGALFDQKPREVRQNPLFQVIFNARPHLARLARERYRTAKIRHRAACAPQGRRHAGSRQGQIHRRLQPAEPGLCLGGPFQPCPWDHQGYRYQGCENDAGCARRLDGKGPCRRQLQPLHLRPAAEEPRRLAAAADQPRRACKRQGALCRRSLRRRGGGDAGAGARCRRSHRDRHRAPARRDQCGGSHKARRAAALRSHPQQRRARLPLWRQRQDRRGVRRRRACDKTRHRQQPHRRGGNGAAGGARRLRSQVRALHAAGARRKASPATR